MKNIIGFAIITLVSLASCQKKINTEKIDPPVGDTTRFVKYIIKKGDQYSNYSSFTHVDIDQLSFIVKFDSSAIYKTIDPNNQNDINKLLGFSDNNALHHDFSARFGWNWRKDALYLYAYNYNNGVRSSKSLGTIELGTENSCSIKVSGSSYIFTLNGNSLIMPRESTTPIGSGYKLYPYFGGDEVAPHTISIWIKEL